ncbi:response regulator transcription factor [Mesobacillus subterraneus]|uniref:response regulator transcription factor n=1 Tax=Mesobacillus subterraneus TaxID=285983 RepID=UPI001CFED48C|nr:response regulator transcription factor [Mesobacillus subterraneus]WLR55488.1 response regulator transcription factor [Mesobacillus subterraneus]
MRIIIVDDHPLVRRGLGTILSGDKNIELVGEASTLEEALQVLKDTNPDLALIDLSLGDAYGLDIVETARTSGIQCKFVVLTSSAAPNDIKKAQSLHVDGFCLKEALPEELIYALQLIHKGRKYYDPAIMDVMMNSDFQMENEEDFLKELTPKEIEVLKELGRGFSNKEIAETLFITEYTVKKHVSQILSKLELADRTQAALLANSKGLVQFSLN